MTETVLDMAHAAMEAAPADNAARMAFYNRLAEAELFVLLTSEAVGDRIEPDLFEVDDGTFALVFDREDRLAEFAGGPAPYAALSGRAIAGILAGQGIGLGVNLGTAEAALLPGGAMDWLAETLDVAPSETDARPVEIRAPQGIPQALLKAIDGKLAASGGMARLAYLVSVIYAPARPGHMLAFVDAVPGAEAALGRGISEALIFSGLEAGELDVGFFDASDPISAKLAKVGLRFDLPLNADERVRKAPGLDPERPPKLR